MRAMRKRKRQDTETSEREKCGRSAAQQIKDIERMLNSISKSSLDFDKVYAKFSCVNEPLITSDELELLLWKMHHARTSLYRDKLAQSNAKSLNSETQSKRAAKDRASILEFITKGSHFYEVLLANVKKDEQKISKASMHNTCRRLLTRLGDLARYKQDFSRNDDFSIAKQYYEQASKVCCSDGNAHNQLAVVSMYTGDAVRALYHHLRSLYIETPAFKGWENLAQTMAKVETLTSKKQAPSLKFALLASALLKKAEQLPELLADESIILEAFPNFIASAADKALTGIHVVAILIVSIEDFHSGTIRRSSAQDSPQPPRIYLHYTLEAALKLVHLLVNLTIEDPLRRMLPAVGVFLLWLLDTEDVLLATSEASELRRVFVALLERAECLSLALKEAGETEPVSSVAELWEDQELKGFTLVRLGEVDEHTAVAYGEKAVNAARIQRLVSTLDAIKHKTGLAAAGNVEEIVVLDTQSSQRQRDSVEQPVGAVEIAQSNLQATSAPLHTVVDAVPDSVSTDSPENFDDAVVRGCNAVDAWFGKDDAPSKSGEKEEPSLVQEAECTPGERTVDDGMTQLSEKQKNKESLLQQNAHVNVISSNGVDSQDDLTAEKKLEVKLQLMKQELDRVKEQESEQLKAKEEMFEQERNVFRTRISELENELSERTQQGLQDLRELEELRKMKVEIDRRKADQDDLLMQLEVLYDEEQVLRKQTMQVLRNLVGGFH